MAAFVTIFSKKTPRETGFEKEMTSASITVATSQVNTAYVAETAMIAIWKRPVSSTVAMIFKQLGTGLKDTIDALPAGTSASQSASQYSVIIPSKHEVLLDRPNIIIKEAWQQTHRRRFYLHRTTLRYYEWGDYPKPRD